MSFSLRKSQFSVAEFLWYIYECTCAADIRIVSAYKNKIEDEEDAQFLKQGKYANSIISYKVLLIHF